MHVSPLYLCQLLPSVIIHSAWNRIHWNYASKVCVCVHPTPPPLSFSPLNCECNSAGVSQPGLSRAGDPEKEQTEMEGEKGGRKQGGGRGEGKKEKSLIFIDMRIMMVPNRECEHRDLWIKCVCVCVSVRIHSSTKTCLFADKTHTSSISLLYKSNVSNCSQSIDSFLHSSVFPATARKMFSDNRRTDKEVGLRLFLFFFFSQCISSAKSTRLDHV